MKVVNRINTADANSQYINNVISSLSETRPAGLTVIQYISDAASAESFSKPATVGMENMNTVLAADKHEVYEILKAQAAGATAVVFGTVEDAKVYIKYSHVLIIDGSLTVEFNGSIPEFDNDKIYLTDIADNDALDAKIYKKFLADNHIDEYSFESHTIEKLIREANCIIPSDLIFHHSFSYNFSFRFNIWMSNLMAIVNLNGEIVKADGICVHGEMNRGIPESCKDTVLCIKYIDSKIAKRFDDDVSEVLQYFNKVFTANLKNHIDKGNISRESLVEEMKSVGIENIYYSALNKGDAKKLVLAYCFPPFNDTSGNVMAKRIFESGDIVDVI